jgi:hypothetical protein
MWVVRSAVAANSRMTALRVVLVSIEVCSRRLRFRVDCGGDREGLVDLVAGDGDLEGREDLGESFGFGAFDVSELLV